MKQKLPPDSRPPDRAQSKKPAMPPGPDAPTPDMRFSIEELSTLAGMPRRTVRYYIQIGLIDRPEGAKRGAYYTHAHLGQLLAIRGWRQSGISLEGIQQLMMDPDALLHARTKQPGEIAVRSHITLCPGVELSIEPMEAGLSPKAVRKLVRDVTALASQLQKKEKK